MIIDTHCHLNDEALLSNVEEVISNAKKVGVELFIVPGWDKKSSEIAVQLADRFDCVYAAVGFHPENLDNLSEKDFNDTLELSKHPKVVAIGEIGLDYHWEKDTQKQEIQKDYFIKQLEYANKHNLPVIIHNREAFLDCITILNNHKPINSGVMHCYGGSVESLNDIKKLNLFIGLDGPVTFKNSKTPKEVAKAVDLNMLVVETDCPYLAPHPLRGTLNEPKNLPLILEEIACLRETLTENIEGIIYNNSLKLFGIKK